MKRGHCTLETQKVHAQKLGGVLGHQLLHLPIKQVIPDPMHMVVAITKKLVSLLAHEVIHWSDLLEMWAPILQKCGMRIPLEQAVQSGRRHTFFDWWENAHPMRLQSLAIIHH
jgi:hypothetical protein